MNGSNTDWNATPVKVEQNRYYFTQFFLPLSF